MFNFLSLIQAGKNFSNAIKPKIANTLIDPLPKNLAVRSLHLLNDKQYISSRQILKFIKLGVSQISLPRQTLLSFKLFTQSALCLPTILGIVKFTSSNIFSSRPVILYNPLPIDHTTNNIKFEPLPAKASGLLHGIKKIATIKIEYLEHIKHVLNFTPISFIINDGPELGQYSYWGCKIVNGAAFAVVWQAKRDHNKAEIVIKAHDHNDLQLILRAIQLAESSLIS
ncbi:MAG: hypothetical protein K0S74_959 [Chlamydiales bacterium]|jgi:hypothetical protein|nr:hypothetical protein [Chlamydiales bacterium]